MEAAALDKTVPQGVGSRPSGPTGHVPRARVAVDDSTTTANDFEASVAASSWGDKPLKREDKKIEGVSPEEEAAIKEVLNDLMTMTDIERADLIDELTRKALVLMEAGEIEEATKQLQSITRIGAAFQHLQGGEEKKPRKMTDEEYLGVRSQGEVLTQMQRDLHAEDFRHIFGGKAKWAQFIGAW